MIARPVRGTFPTPRNNTTSGHGGSSLFLGVQIVTGIVLAMQLRAHGGGRLQQREHIRPAT